MAEPYLLGLLGLDLPHTADATRARQAERGTHPLVSTACDRFRVATDALPSCQLLDVAIAATPRDGLGVGADRAKPEKIPPMR
ncbi:hypothetical protein [Nonomuraea angiospora]|uniref:hypothetical protein n=1 Tax=Nonomuraea angiospora TaxID=46172 RepID=UPI0029B43B12|nr:hypothetical protein [Nonomuraea angiospora]MDX3100279.1 hypothetical protein [Nonomuraea angiospora]